MEKLSSEQFEAVKECMKAISHKRERPSIDEDISFRLKEKGLIKEEFEVGEHYFLEDDTNFIRVYSGGNIGYSLCGNYKETVMHKIQKWTKLTPKEVEEALIKEAKKRGFEQGVNIEGLEGTTCVTGSLGGNWILNKLGYFVDNNSCCMFYNGKWAEIIEEKSNRDKAFDEISRIGNMCSTRNMSVEMNVGIPFFNETEVTVVKFIHCIGFEVSKEYTIHINDEVSDELLSVLKSIK